MQQTVLVVSLVFRGEANHVAVAGRCRDVVPSGSGGLPSLTTVF